MRSGLGAATVQRYFEAGLKRQFGQWHPPRCPPVLGIDEHFFTRRKGFATTLCDLRRHKVYDVVLGRSEAALAAYFDRLQGKAEVKLVCMNLSSTYRSLVRKHFPMPSSSPTVSTSSASSTTTSWPAGVNSIPWAATTAVC